MIPKGPLGDLPHSHRVLLGSRPTAMGQHALHALHTLLLRHWGWFTFGARIASLYNTENEANLLRPTLKPNIKAHGFNVGRTFCVSNGCRDNSETVSAIGSWRQKAKTWKRLIHREAKLYNFVGSFDTSTASITYTVTHHSTRTASIYHSRIKTTSNSTKKVQKKRFV